MKLGKADTPKLIALGVLIALFLGYAVYSATSRKASAKSPARAAQRTPSAVDRKPDTDKIPTAYVGRYVGRYTVGDSQAAALQGKADITIDDSGAISGHTWIPTKDGGPGLICFVTGRADKSGSVSFRSDRAAGGRADGTVEGADITQFQFSHAGRLEQLGSRVSLSSVGKGRRGSSERLVADLMSPSQQVVSAALQSTQTGRRDPFAPCYVPEQFTRTCAPRRPTLPRLGTLPPLIPPGARNLALGINPLPSVSPGVTAVDPDPQFAVTGVIIGPTSVAIIRAGESERHIVREGQFINGKYLVKSITRDHVVLKCGHRNIHLRLGGSANAS